MHRASRRYPVCLARGCIEPILDPRASQFCPACQRARAAAAEATEARGRRKARVPHVTSTSPEIRYATVTLQAEPWPPEGRA